MRKHDIHLQKNPHKIYLLSNSRNIFSHYNNVLEIQIKFGPYCNRHYKSSRQERVSALKKAYNTTKEDRKRN